MQRLRQNLVFKILSLIGAFALFLYVGKQQATESPEYSTELVLTPPPGLEVVEPKAPRQVRVKLRGPAEKIRTLDETQIKALVDLTGRRRGFYSGLPVQIVLPPNLRDQVQIVYNSPTLLNVRLDEHVSRQFQVEPVMLTQPPSGYSVDLPRLEPSTVMITGQGEVVQRVKKVQAHVTAINSTERLDQLVRVSALDDQNMEVGDGIQINPPTVRVRAAIERNIWSKPLYVDPDVGPLPEGLRLKQLVVTPERVTATGPDEALARLWVVRTVRIPLSDQATRIDQPVLLKRPPGVRSISPTMVRVHVELESVARSS
jgi:YbbR domain-containing protein